MREIEFRIYNKKNEKMESVWSIDNARNLINDEQSYYFINSIHEKKSELMQYTGLKDKNNKKIFEGDIVKSDDYFGGDDETDSTNLLEVEFREGKFVAKLIGAFGQLDLVDVDKLCEVIGNIYENSELLK